MGEKEGAQMIQSLRSKCIGYSLAADLLAAAGVAFLLTILCAKLFSCTYWWGLLFFALVTTGLIIIHGAWKISEQGIARLLDKAYPQLQESSALLLRPWSSLQLLEQWQQQKTRLALASVHQPLQPAKKMVLPACLLLASVLAGMGIRKIPFTTTHPAQRQSVASTRPAKPEILLPQVASMQVRVAPPAYTGRPTRQQQEFNLVAEQGSFVQWQLQTTRAAGRVQMIFNDSLQAALEPAGADHTKWQLGRKVDSTGFYQLKIDGKISEPYRLEIIPDQAPVVLLQQPKQYTTIDIGEPQQVKIKATVADDYGVTAASIDAIIASGSGEAVKFKEQKIAFPGFAAGKTQYQLEQLLLLPQMGMQPGDELYFYVQATDQRGQQTKTEIYIVHLPDTAQLMSLEGLANSLTLKPEYFRSQRQIIIETEQLLKDKDTISEESFKNRSNNLGIDQKLLRLRYGKFLGDETETGQDDHHELEDLANFSDAEKLKDAYTDKHDNAEDATFFEPETKKQLQATLAEMWDAEIRLRTFTPQSALPFEYKALRLLKDLQQKSRAYVAKTNFKTTAPDPGKRLKGDLSKIDPAVIQADRRPPPEMLAPVRTALSVLDAIGNGQSGPANAPEILQKAGLRLHEAAIRQPNNYLDAAEAMKKIQSLPAGAGMASARDITLAQQGLQRLLLAPDLLPAAAKSNSMRALSKQYFEQLQKKQP